MEGEIRVLDIRSLFQQIPMELTSRREKKEVLKEQFRAHEKELVIYGHGNLGTELEKGLKNAGWPVRYFLDANKPTDLEQKRINLKDAAQYLGRDALIIVALYDILSAYPSIRSSLQKEGFHNIVSILDLRVWPELFQAGHMHSTIGWDIEHIPEKQVLEAYSLLADSMSQKVFCELLHFTVDAPYKEMTLCPAAEQYMPSELYAPIKNECIVDCGAFDGDTMRMFLSAIGTWQSYTAIDADPYNIEKVKASIQHDIPERLRAVTQAVHAAVSNGSGTVSFHAGNRTASHISEEETAKDTAISVPVVKLDDIINGPVTLIKMDVEGFELRALQGAEGLILTNQPLLTICGYHCQADLWEIPQHIKKLLPNHSIYLRNYVGLIEYVFYAVPPDRVLP